MRSRVSCSTGRRGCVASWTVLLVFASLFGSAAAESSVWLSPAKFGHVVAAGGITTIGAGMAQGMLHADRRRAVLYGASAAIVAGGAKEFCDWKFGPTRRFDLRDFALDFAGAGLGVAATEVAAGGFAWRNPTTAGEVMAATSQVMLAGTLVTSLGVLPWLDRERRQDWCLPLGLVGAGGTLLSVASYVVKYFRARDESGQRSNRGCHWFVAASTASGRAPVPPGCTTPRRLDRSKQADAD
jgi:hypothetical protein